MRLSAEEISQAKDRANLHQPYHEHDDGIRMAYEWLDAQKTTKGSRRANWKELIQRWSGGYVSADDVEIAAQMHPRINGKGPKLNISKRLCLPSDQRLHDISNARKHFANVDEETRKGYSEKE